jgi:hypothetical protein
MLLALLVPAYRCTAFMWHDGLLTGNHVAQVAETLDASVLAKMHAPDKPKDIPIISANDLPEADGFIFGFPTRFGMMCAQMKALFDSTGSLWQQGMVEWPQLLSGHSKKNSSLTVHKSSLQSLVPFRM